MDAFCTNKETPQPPTTSTPTLAPSLHAGGALLQAGTDAVNNGSSANAVPEGERDPLEVIQRQWLASCLEASVNAIIAQRINTLTGATANALDRAEATFMEEALCGICFRAMHLPSITQCGHEFCGECILKVLSTQLDDRIERYGRVYAPEGTALPSITNSPALNTDIIRLGGNDPTQLYHYFCPVCRAYMTKAPIVSPRMGMLVKAIQENLGEGIGEVEVENGALSDIVNRLRLYFA